MYSDLIDKGYACLRRSDLEAARVRFQHAIDAEPARPQAYFGLAQVFLELGEKEEVQQALEKALACDPGYAQARAYLALELLKEYKIYQAEEQLDQALKDAPLNLLVHIKYAEYYYRLGFYPRAVEILQQGLKAPHGANEHVVALAKQLLNQALQKSKNLIIREPPDLRPRRLLELFARLRRRKDEPVVEVAG